MTQDNQVCVCVDIDEEFKRELVNLLPLLLAPENLMEKEISGSKVTCRDLLQYFRVRHFSIWSQSFRCMLGLTVCFSVAGLHEDLSGRRAAASQVHVTGTDVIVTSRTEY